MGGNTYADPKKAVQHEGAVEETLTPDAPDGTPEVAPTPQPVDPVSTTEP